MISRQACEEVNVGHVPGDPGGSRPSPPSHRPRKPRRRGMAAGAGLLAALAGLGVAVATGAVPAALTAGAATPLSAAKLRANLVLRNTPPQPSASSLGFATAHLPATKPPAPKRLTPSPTAENQTPQGENEKAWSQAILTSLGAPLTSANIISLGYWMQNEAGSPPSGIVGANNPLNVSQACCGGVPIQSDGDGVTYLQSYPTVADGVQAATRYLERPNYTRIVADLRAGVGLMSDPRLAGEISLYSGGGYSKIPDSWGASQGTPLS